jgi:hypothetical protein
MITTALGHPRKPWVNPKLTRPEDWTQAEIERRVVAIMHLAGRAAEIRISSTPMPDYERRAKVLAAELSALDKLRPLLRHRPAAGDTPTPA